VLALFAARGRATMVATPQLACKVAELRLVAVLIAVLHVAEGSTPTGPAVLRAAWQSRLGAARRQAALAPAVRDAVRRASLTDLSSGPLE
jgi:hypothetical protein